MFYQMERQGVGAVGLPSFAYLADPDPERREVVEKEDGYSAVDDPVARSVKRSMQRRSSKESARRAVTPAVCARPRCLGENARPQVSLH